MPEPRANAARSAGAAGDVDLAVVGPMARSAGDLGLLLDVIAGPERLRQPPIGWRSPPSRRDELKSFRVLVLDSHPLVPTAAAVRGAVERLAERLAKAGVKVARSSPLLPDLAVAARIYVQLLSRSCGRHPMERYRRVQELAAALPADDTSLAATRLRAIVLSHRDWVAASRVRIGIAQHWRELFREWDVVLCPAMPTPAFPHDHTPQQSAALQIDDKEYPYEDQVVWAGVATLPGLPATAVPIDRSDRACPSACRSSAHIWRTARRSPSPGSRARVRRIRASAGVRGLIPAPQDLLTRER